MTARATAFKLNKAVSPPKRSTLRPRLAPYLFLAPNLVIFGIFVLFPALYNFALSVYSGSQLSDLKFVGLQNFDQLFNHEDLFWRAAGNTLVFVIGDVVMTVLLSLGIALLLNRKVKLRAFFRSAFFYPVLLSPVVVALIWKWILQSQYGVLNAALAQFGLHKIPWLLNSNWAMFWTIAINIWASVGFYALMLMAGLQSIPSVLYEAASIDGASAAKQFWNITLPMLMPTMLVVFMLSIIRAFQSFDLIYVMTGGGPGTATLLLVQYIFRAAFDSHEFGLAAAASLVLAVVLLILTGGQLYLGRRFNDAT